MPRSPQGAGKPITEIDDPRLVKALAHPLRVRILRILEDRTASPNQLAVKIDAPLANVSYHVRALARAGLIELADTTQRRGAIEHHYRAVGRVRVTDTAWADVPAIVKAGLVDSTLSQIGEDAAAAAMAGGFERAEAALMRQPLELDDEGFRALCEETLAFVDRAREISVQSERRLRATSHVSEGVSASLAVMLFETAAVAGQAGEPPAD